MKKLQINPHYSALKPLVENLQEFFPKNGEVITAGRNTIKKILYDNQQIVVKSFKIPNKINRFAYRFIRDSKAKRSYLNALKLLELGINTPEPIAYIEHFTPLLKESYYLCRYFDFDFEIRHLLQDPHFKEREAILRAFAAFSYRLHERGVYHIDYSPGNVLVKKAEGGYIFSIVDVNRMRFVTFDDALRFQNLSRFSASDTDTEFIAEAYADIAGIERDYALRKLRYFHNRHQAYLRRKRRLKGLKS